jgi:hypothetical protein
MERGLDVNRLQTGIVSQNFIRGHALSAHTNDHLDWDARAADDGFPHHARLGESFRDFCRKKSTIDKIRQLCYHFIVVFINSPPSGNGASP